MRILHTADWHLGRTLAGVSLIEDQKFALDQFFDIVDRERPDVVIIAGDLYDRAIPPTNAIALFDRSLVKLAEELKVPVIAIPGNHDSADRLAFGSAFFRARRVHLATALDDYARPIVLRDAKGDVEFYSIPYCEPVEARLASGDETVHSHDAGMRALLRGIPPGTGSRRVLVAHAFVDGGSTSESERPLSVGGVETVGADALDGFDYVALGHLHAPQAVGAGKVRYSGSLCRYSFSEEKQEKALTLVSLDGGAVEIEEILLRQRRGMRTIEGTFDELKERASSDTAREDYLRIRLLDRAPVLDAKARLERYYPNILEILRPQFEHAGEVMHSAERIRELAPIDHFREFFRYIRQENMTPDQEKVLQRVIQSISQKEN